MFTSFPGSIARRLPSDPVTVAYRLLPESYSAEERRECQGALQRAASQVERLARELDGDDGIRARIRALVIPEGLLERSEAIMALHRRIDDHQNALRDLPKRRTEWQTHRARAQELFRNRGCGGQ